LRLGKPPVIELWIEFQYALTEDAPEWTLDRARALIKKCFGERFHVEAYRERKDFMIADPDVESEPQVQILTTIDRIRATTKEKDKYIQAGKDILVYNVIRTEQKWPYFEDIKPEAITAAEKYGLYMKLGSLESVSLHYRDVLKFPLDGENRISLQDYLTIYPETPEEEWAVQSGFSIGMTLPNLSKDAIVKLVIETEPSFVEEDESGARHGCLRMDWHATTNITLGGAIDIERWLDRAHTDLISAFRKTFTDKGFAFFEPMES
jgi:uncharacterized protein (TIGR04255 family)